MIKLKNILSEASVSPSFKKMRDKIKQVINLCSDDGVYVNDRGQRTVSAWSKIKYFRQVFGSDYGVQFKIMEHSDRAVIMKCMISTKDPEFVITSTDTFLPSALPRSVDVVKVNVVAPEFVLL